MPSNLTSRGALYLDHLGGANVRGSGRRSITGGCGGGSDDTRQDSIAREPWGWGVKIPKCSVCGNKMVKRVESVRKGKKYTDVEYYACRVHGAPGRM